MQSPRPLSPRCNMMRATREEDKPKEQKPPEYRSRYNEYQASLHREKDLPRKLGTSDSSAAAYSSREKFNYRREEIIKTTNRSGSELQMSSPPRYSSSRRSPRTESSAHHHSSSRSSHRHERDRSKDRDRDRNSRRENRRTEEDRRRNRSKESHQRREKEDKLEERYGLTFFSRIQKERISVDKVDFHPGRHMVYYKNEVVEGLKLIEKLTAVKARHVPNVQSWVRAITLVYWDLVAKAREYIDNFGKWLHTRGGQYIRLYQVSQRKTDVNWLRKLNIKWRWRTNKRKLQ